MSILKPATDIPGRTGLPFWGETFELFGKWEAFYWERFQRYGSIFRTRIMGRNYVFLIGADATRLVLVEQADKLSSRLGWFFLEPLFGQGVLLQDGEQHRVTRRLMYPAFHGKAIATYFDTVQAIVKTTLQSWATRGTIPLVAECRKLTLAIAARLFVGAEDLSDIEQVSQWYLELFEARLALVKLDLPFTLYRRGQRARRHLISFLQAIIAKRQQQGNLQDSKDALGLLLTAIDEDGNRLSEAQIIDEVLLLLFAGHETTATLLTWLLFELSDRPDWQQKLRTEQAAVLENASLMVAQLKQLTQLTHVLKEVERLYPPVFGFSRGVLQPIEYAGYEIPAGWYVTISPMLTHRLPELYTDPDRFDPDRFAPPREEDKKHPLALVGFGSGIHSCLGFEFAQMEMKIMLSELLRHYDWSITPSREELGARRQPTKLQDRLQAKFVAR